MTNPPDMRQGKAYRRGLVLGLTMAEVMILLIFLLLMALAAALANREERLQLFEGGEVSRLVEVLQEAYPQANNADEMFRELRRAVEVAEEVERTSLGEASEQMARDAAIGRSAREAAAEAGVDNPQEYIEGTIQDLEAGRLARFPPFISLSEAGGYYFDSGLATLRPEFERNLVEQVIPMLAEYVRDYDVDVIEVIGHTDEVPMAGESNLDRRLIDASRGRALIGDLRSTDNAGLAMARAVAVVRILRADRRLREVTILPLSGAQMIVPVDRMADGSATGDDELRRRIEIRLRRTTEQARAPEVQ